MSKDKTKKVCFFGIFDPQYARNRVLIKGFRENGYEVILCQTDPGVCKGVRKYIDLFKKGIKIKKNSFEYIIVAFPGHTVVWLAYILFGRKIIFDVFVSLYNSEVEDRESHSKFSFKAFYYWSLDRYSMILPRTLLMETDEHIDFLVDKFKISKKKFIKVFVGSDDERVYPIEKEAGDKFVVHFHGTGIPLQGIEYIVDAANVLKTKSDIEFVLYGNLKVDIYEQAIKKAEKLNLNNIKFYDVFLANNISEILSRSNISLGIFGNTVKTKKVIPNKAFESWAAKKALITANTPAIRELVTDRKEVLLCKGADGEDLAEKILELYNDPALLNKLATNGYAMYKSKLKPEKIVTDLITELENER